MDIYWLNQITPLEHSLVGEKAFALSQLLQKNYPVQSGFVISTATLQKFLKTLEGSETVLSDLYLDVDNYQVLQAVAQQRRQEIFVTPLPEQWLSELMSAARSLAASTLILRASPRLSNLTRQRVTGLLPAQIARCESRALAIALKQIWSELFSARSLFFWQRLEISLEQLQVAVLVQPIYNAIASGTLAIYPARIQIQATRGLGHSLIRGEILPDFYDIDLTTGKRQWYLGNKVLAYRLRRSQAGDSPNSCLETYILEDKEQEQFALSQTDVDNLIKLSQQLASYQSEQAFLEWTITQEAQETSPQLYLTQLEPNQQPTAQEVNQRQASPTSELLLTGVAAAPGQAIALAYVLTETTGHLQAIPDGSIIITQSLAPNGLTLLKRAAGVVTEQGGLTSHTAIIARELGIPAVVGATEATKLVETGESILLNGVSGEVYRLLKEKIEAVSQQNKKSGYGFSSVQSPVPLATQLLVNLRQPSAIAQATAWPIDGIGVLQSELRLSSGSLVKGGESSPKLLLIEQLTEYISQFAAAFIPRPVFLQISERNLLDFARSLPPAQWDRTLLDSELEAVARVRALGYTNVNLLLPGVRSLREFTFFYRRAEVAGLVEQDSFQLWLMIDVPSVPSFLPQYVQAGIQGIVIDTDRLLPLLLGISNQSNLNLSMLHPAMLATLKQLVEQANQAEISSCVCSRAAIEYPNLVDKLVEWGITAVSVDPQAVEATYSALARAEQRLLIKAARQQLKPLL